MRKLVAVIFLSMILSESVSATHKSWVRYESGSSCIDNSWTINSQVVVNNESVWNPTTGTIVTIHCPIKLGGSFQDLSHGIPQHTKVPSMRIQVFYYDGNDESNMNVLCNVAALTSTGSERLARYPMTSCSAVGGCSYVGGLPVEPNFMGAGHLGFADPSGIANRRIGVIDAATIAGVTNYSISCNLPPAGRGGWTGIMGILTQTCQRDPSVAGFVCQQ